MKLNILLPWICVLGLTVALGKVYVSSSAKNQELATLREAKEQSDQLRTELDQVKSQAKAQEQEIVGLRSDKQELLRLRNEIGTLRTERQQLNRQLETAQSQAQRAQSQIAQTTTAAAEQLQQLQAENQRLRSTAASAQNVQVSQLNACINNLRQIDGAKQQWALENGKTAQAIPTADEVSRYLSGNKFPTCPAGGTYTINAIGAVPACSIPGHALPQ